MVPALAPTSLLFTATSPHLAAPAQAPGGPEILILVMVLSFGLVPLLVFVAAAYFVYDTRRQLGELREEVERLKQTQ